MRQAALILALAGVCLAGCFVSKGPLIEDGKAAFPYEKIVYAEKGSSDTTTIVHRGSDYVLQPKSADSEGRIRLLKVADDLYVVQLGFVDDQEEHYLYGLLKVDLAGKTVTS